MSSPNNVIFVRHGQSEVNTLQEAEKAGRSFEVPEELRMRPDWAHRLTDKGIAQAEAAGAWILQNIKPLEDFDALYCSAFMRARETAAHLGGAACMWRPHNLIHERDWGEYGATPRSEQSQRYPFASRMKQVAPLYARLNGGEAIADSVTLRVRDYRATLKRKWSDQDVLTVTHGDVIGTVRYVFEEMLPEQWHESDKDKAQRIGNCAILWYTKVNPEDPLDIRSHLHWRRMIQPDNLKASPFDGEWREMPDNRFMSGAQLLDSIEQFPRLLS
jgi:broad specificity phosphatase PhoE